ncbi:hypothetical protein GUITHDRAFT_143999 [Guillardia theta CCMP2712]|uniref:Mitochondrial phosphate carrier protein n=1 Tax=Guillardia theta (strain CCMP2712) TaxID=905079 RepID=L1ISG3_GUITC|nr:hypothetical protein GUITHDRAFT_143999 [Guillardia theta CCMP2712]EKX38819.1 hypothetical protein GUITHDRAFT_143999 [Guillardia theta CCMP2712]|eukprot:XP_005825799.1 hypothetical protein GUITHDRAFT_143999 [Guillardia theta CCMP2712]
MLGKGKLLVVVMVMATGVSGFSSFGSLRPRRGDVNLRRLEMVADADIVNGVFPVSADALKYFLAGGISASVSHGGTVPIDVVKTRLQTDPSMRNSNFIVGTKTIIRNEGASTLLGGLGSTLIGYAIQGSLKYGFYELFKPVVLAKVTDQKLVAFLLAAAMAELIGSTALCPLEATRIRLVADPSYGREVFDALPRLIEEKTPAIKFTISTLCAMVAAIASSLASQPGDSILSEVNKGGEKTIADVIKSFELSDYFRGTQARLVHMMSIVTVQLVLYDIIKASVGLSATGAH